jgi:spore germination protein GerM
MATLYYPVNAGRGVAAETRLITAQSRSLDHIALALLEALSVTPSNLPNTLPLPDLRVLLTQPPIVEDSAGSTGRIVRLNFHENLNEAMIAAGIPRSVMMASLTYTLTTFLPYTAGVSVTIGNELISALVPAGLYEGAGEQILFEDGIMQRSLFSRFLLDNCSLYFANAHGSLTLTKRPIPYYQVNNPRYLMTQLMAGPMNTDSVTGLSPVLPDDLKDADLLGITRQNETTLVHFSDNLRLLANDYSHQQELLMVYAMVNTLTRQRDIKQICFFIDGRQEGVFTNEIDIAGVFLRNEGIIHN